MTTRASGRWISAPIPCESAAGGLERPEEQDEDDEDDQRDDDVELRQRTLLVLEAAAPHHLVSRRQADARLDLLHRLLDQAAHVALADAPLDRHAALVAFA